MKTDIVLLSLLRCTLEKRSAIYCAVPITSGIRLWRLTNRLGLNDPDCVKETDRARYTSEVFEPNCAAAADFARGARNSILLSSILRN